MRPPKMESPLREKYWRSLRERDESPEFQQALADEWPEGASDPPDGVSRRDFFRTMGASMALAGLAACRRPDEKIMPYSRQPEDLIPGVPLYFATAMPWNGTAIGLLVESHEGRPTKIEGNPRHPESLGATNSWAQAAVLNLYDPDRSTSPADGRSGTQRTWEEATAALRELGQRFAQAGGRGLAVLTEAHRSPTTARMLAELKKAMPAAQVFRYHPFARDGARQGARLAFGAPLEAVLDLSKARVVVALDADLLMFDGSSDVRHAKQLSAARRVTASARAADGGTRLYAVESTFSVTGAYADHRLRLTSREVTAFAVALAAELGAAAGLEAPKLSERARTYLTALLRDLRDHRGASVIVAGEKQPPVVHALACALNLVLANVGQTVSYVPPFDEASEGAASMVALAQAIREKQVTALVMLGGNPAFDAPGDARLRELLPTLEASVHLSTHRDETSALCSWHLNRAHFLEAWSDVRALDGTASIVQPLIAPIFDGKSDAEVLSMLLGTPQRGYDLVRATHGGAPAAGGNPPEGFEQGWRRALHDGLLPQTAFEPSPATRELKADSLAAAAREALAPAAGIEVTFVPDAHAWDGSFANNGWMQEQPDPMTKLTWGSAALISPATARQLSVGDGDLLSLTGADGGQIVIPALVMVGQADGSLTVGVGQGRSVGRVAAGVGVDVAPLRTSKSFWVASVQLAKTGGSEQLARTQEHFSMEQRALVRETTAAAYAANPKFVEGYEVPGPELRSLYDDKDYSKVQRWALAIDLTTCTGCSACVTACVSENNIPVVGKHGVLMSREMQWIRVDRYFKGSPEDPESVTQPMTCQQCENAPCEAVCPVAATQHSPEGLNDMAYNRCIGTKYCLNNCPFKVRHFNFFNYAKSIPEIRRAQFNPDVTIRSRGVMEKCTYCVQRINSAKIDAHRSGQDRVADGAIKTACQQVCPADAIVFGDLNDPKSQVAKMKDEPRSYVLLREINVRPRTTYLAKIRNKNTEIA